MFRISLLHYILNSPNLIEEVQNLYVINLIFYYNRIYKRDKIFQASHDVSSLLNELAHQMAKNQNDSNESQHQIIIILYLKRKIIEL